MHHSKGSFSLIFLAALLFLTMFAQIMLHHFKNDFQRTYNYTKVLQQRLLCASSFAWFLSQPKTIENISFQHQFAPENYTVNVSCNRTISTDQIFEYATATALAGENQYKLKQLAFYPSQDMQLLGSQYMFISKYEPSGTEFLKNGTLYTSNGNFILPKLDFLTDKAHWQIDMDEIHEYGFSDSFTYLDASTNLTYDSTAKITKGNGLLACKNSITLKKYFKATGKLVLLSNSSITLEEKVDLANVLIIAKGNVNIASGCKIKGVIFSGSKIKLAGSGTFTHDASVVANYASAIFIA